MTRWVNLTNRTDGNRQIACARWCDSFGCRLRGLMFRRSLPSGRGLLLVQRRESRLDAAIHMLFMFIPLGVVWLDSDGQVVDSTVARPWRFYLPRRPARYVLESGPELLESIHLGDRIQFEDV